MHRNKCHIVCDRFLHLNAIQFTLFRNSRRAVMHLILCTNRYLTIITIPIFIQNEPEQRPRLQKSVSNITNVVKVYSLYHISQVFYIFLHVKEICVRFSKWAKFGSFIVIFHYCYQKGT